MRKKDEIKKHYLTQFLDNLFVPTFRFKKASRDIAHYYPEIFRDELISGNNEVTFYGMNERYAFFNLYAGVAGLFNGRFAMICYDRYQKKISEIKVFNFDSNITNVFLLFVKCKTQTSRRFWFRILPEHRQQKFQVIKNVFWARLNGIKLNEPIPEEFVTINNKLVSQSFKRN